MSEFKATVLIDNIPNSGLECEWGLSIHISYRGKNFLLDTGASSRFLQNAERLGIRMEDVDYGILSHAHYDHSDGMSAFFAANAVSKFYLRKSSAENCYSKHGFFKKYIGIKKGTLHKYAERIIYADGKYALSDGVWLLPHTTEHLEEIGAKAKMYQKVSHRWKTDDFSHEQSLVFETEKGLVIFNSCSHGGADNIISEVSAAFPNNPIYAMIGGFHLFRSSESDVLAFANRVKDTGIEKVLTGHCTGQKAYDIMHQVLGESLEQISSGFVFEI